MQRVQSVSFDNCITVHAADNYDRSSPWMLVASDRMRFRRRIEQIELILAPILGNDNRLVILMSRLNIK